MSEDPFNNPNTRALVLITLEAAVPLWRMQIQSEGWSWERIQAEAQECSQMIAEHGDNIMFRSKVKGETAKAFNALAKGIALLSFCPGGVKPFGGALRFGNDDTQQAAFGTLPELSEALEQVGLIGP